MAALPNSTPFRMYSPLVLVVSGFLSFSGDLMKGKRTTKPCVAYLEGGGVMVVVCVLCVCVCVVCVGGSKGGVRWVGEAS